CEGSHSADLHKQIEEYSLKKYVLFKGFQDNPLDWMAASDVVVVPSRSEGLPLVIMEAFRSGTPVVAFSVPGCQDAITDGLTGIIVPAFELDQFREAIETLINDSELAKEISNNARRELETRFSYNRMIFETIEVYRNIGFG
ncbi:MAG: glycosyltransferase involved in cell wall biosynthesis, partial [Limisphaerales bacterium]